MRLAGSSYVAGLLMPFCCQKKFHLPPSQALLAHMFSRDRDKNVFRGGGAGGDWSDSYISRMQGHPHHLGISWRWLQPPVNPSQGSFEIQGKSPGQEQAGLAQREEKETSGRAVRLLRLSAIGAHPTASSACTNTALVTPGCALALCSCQAVSSSMPPLTLFPLSTMFSPHCFAVLTPTQLSRLTSGVTFLGKPSLIPFVLPQMLCFL